jgi:hypothetical protein
MAEYDTAAYIQGDFPAEGDLLDLSAISGPTIVNFVGSADNGCLPEFAQKAAD